MGAFEDKLSSRPAGRKQAGRARAERSMKSRGGGVASAGRLRVAGLQARGSFGTFAREVKLSWSGLAGHWRVCWI